jgi:hypothetical protein
MPSASTGRREPTSERFWTRRRRALLSGWAASLLLLTLVGCATGDVDEARVAETREATRGAVVADVQATNVVKEFFPPTATAEPSRTPLPTLATLTLATQIGSNNQPSNEVESVPQGSSVYAVAEIHNLQPGQTVIAVWTTSDGSEVGRTEVPVDRGLSAAWVPLQWTVNVGPGSYAVYVKVESPAEEDSEVDDYLLNSLVFRVN